MKNSRNIEASFALFLLTAASVCWACNREPPQTIIITKAAPNRPAGPLEVKDFESAAAAIITVCKEDLHLPVVDPLKIVLHKNARSFAVAAYGWSGMPMDVSNEVAFTKGNEIHVNLTKGILERGWMYATSALAHEYGHAVKQEISSGHYFGLSWFEEGFADWVEAKALDALGWQPYDIALHQAEAELRHHRDILPKIASLAIDSNWKYTSGKPKGYIRTYRVAFVAVDRLIQKGGLAAVVKYAKSGDFNASFPLSWNDFTAEFDKSFAAPKYASASATFEKPVWKPGARWRFISTVGGKQGERTEEVAGEETYGDVPAYAVNDNERTLHYARETLALLAVTKDGKSTLRRGKGDQFLSWPLTVGKEWRNAYTAYDERNKTTSNFDFSMAAEDLETVTVPAGKFQTIRIAQYLSKSGFLLTEYWYSPKVNWFVKRRYYGGRSGLEEEELAEFSVN